MNVEYSVVVKCYKCDAPILMSPNRERVLRESHETFFCVNGHEQAFLRKTEEQKAQDRKIAALETELQYARNTIARFADEASHFRCCHPRCRFRHKIRKVVLDHMRECSRAAPMKRLPANAGPNALNSRVH